MQNKKITQAVLLQISAEDLKESGIDLFGVIQITAEQGRITIENADTKNALVCDDNCNDCPIIESDCDEDCNNCPCRFVCEESEVEKND